MGFKEVHSGAVDDRVSAFACGEMVWFKQAVKKSMKPGAHT